MCVPEWKEGCEWFNEVKHVLLYLRNIKRKRSYGSALKIK